MRIAAPPALHPHTPLVRLHATFDHPDWLFELKYGAFRALAYLTPQRCKMTGLRRARMRLRRSSLTRIFNVLKSHAIGSYRVLYLAAVIREVLAVDPFGGPLGISRQLKIHGMLSSIVPAVSSGVIVEFSSVDVTNAP